MKICFKHQFVMACLSFIALATGAADFSRNSDLSCGGTKRECGQRFTYLLLYRLGQVEIGMNSKDATEEFVRLLRIGSAALTSVVETDRASNIDVSTELDEIRFLLDSLDEVGERIGVKLRRAG